MNTTQIVTILNFMHVVCYVKYFNLIENFVDIINNKCSLIMGAKYYNSSMSNACITYLANIVSHPAKSHGWLDSFWKRKQFSYGFCVGRLTRESAHEVHLKYGI